MLKVRDYLYYTKEIITQVGNTITLETTGINVTPIKSLYFYWRKESGNLHRIKEATAKPFSIIVECL